MIWLFTFSQNKVFIENINVENIIFRSNHVSNNLILKGTLSKDKDQLVEMLQQAIVNTPNSKYPEAPDML